MVANDNGKRITAEHDGEKIYAPVGYPLGYELRNNVKEIINRNYVYQLEDFIDETYANGKWSSVILTPNEFHIWSHIFSLQEKDKCNELYNEKKYKIDKIVKRKKCFD